MSTWVEKYRPKELKDIVGNPSAIKSVIAWINEFKEGRSKKKAILIYGPPGVGKTSVAHALANELNYDYIELNASDTRTKGLIDSIVGAASSLSTLDPEKGKKILILDEVDGIHGKKESGGLGALKNWIKVTRNPIILIANDPWKLPKDLRAMTQMVEFKKVNRLTVTKIIRAIAKNEGLHVDDKVFELLATNSGGDMRSALNDLQSISEGRKEIRIQDITSLAMMRDSEVKIFDTLVRILKTESIERAREAMWESNEDPDTILKWLAENIALEYKNPQELAMGYNYLSRADVFLGRIRKRQDWVLLKYAADLMSAGVAVSKEKKYGGFVSYKYPSTFIIYAKLRQEKKIMNDIAEKMIERKDSHEGLHGSKFLMKREFFPLFEAVFSNDPENSAEIVSELEFSLEEIDYFVKNEKKSKSILENGQKIVMERIKKKTGKEKAKQASLFEF